MVLLREEIIVNIFLEKLKSAKIQCFTKAGNHKSVKFFYYFTNKNKVLFTSTA